MMQAVATPTPSFFAYWRELLLFFLGSAAVNQFIAVAVADRLFMRAYERCKDQVLGRNREWYRERDAEIDAAIALGCKNADEITFIEASLKEQGKTLADQISGHFAQNTEALRQMTLALSAVQREANATAVAVGRLEGRMAPRAWDGVKRREDDPQ